MSSYESSLANKVNQFENIYTIQYIYFIVRGIEDWSRYLFIFTFFFSFFLGGGVVFQIILNKKY